MKKVVFIGTGFHPIPPVKGAAVETWIDEISKNLSLYEPHIISPYHTSLPLFETVNGVTYYRIKMGRLYTRMFKKITRLDPYSYDKRVADIAAKINPDIVHINNRYWFVPIIRKMLGDSVKIILHMHNNFTLKNNISLNIDKLAGCSNYMRELAAKKFNLPPDDCYTLKNGVDIYNFNPDKKKRNEIRKRFNLETNKVILYVGRVSPEKGIDCLIKTFEIVNRKIRDSRLVIVGEIRKGKRTDCDREEYGRKVLSMAKPLGDKVIFTDLISHSDIPDYYLLGDIFASTSVRIEAFGKVFLEASASGLPIVAARIGGVPEAVKHGYSGYLVDDPFNYTHVAEVIISLLQSPDKSKSMGEYGRKWVEKEHTWEKIAKDVEYLYNIL